MTNSTIAKQASRRKFLKQSASIAAGMVIIPRHVLGGNGYISPSDKITLGFIGTGKQAMGLARRFAEISSVQILAGSDVDQQKLERFIKQNEEKICLTKGNERI